jgi:hypothetical protein
MGVCVYKTCSSYITTNLPNLEVENSAQTTFRFSPGSFCAPRIRFLLEALVELDFLQIKMPWAIMGHSHTCLIIFNIHDFVCTAQQAIFAFLSPLSTWSLKNFLKPLKNLQDLVKFCGESQIGWSPSTKLFCIDKLR